MNFSIGASLYKPAMHKIRITSNSPRIVLHESERKIDFGFLKTFPGALGAVEEGASVHGTSPPFIR